MAVKSADRKEERALRSRTKTHLSEDKIIELARINLGKDCEIQNIRELKGGMFNAIYRMERIREQDTVVLKVGVKPGTPLLTYEQDVMPTEVEGFRLLEEQTTVPAPRVLAYDFSKEHIPANYFFMTAMEGVPLSSVAKKMSRENRDRLLAELAGCLAQMHQIKGPYFGYFTTDRKKQYATWKEAFLQMFGQLLKDCRDRKTKIPYERIERVLKKYAGYLEDLKTAALVEYDCHEGNVFVKKENGEYRIEGILDLERAFWGDPVADFPTAFIFTDDIRRERVFLEGYLKASPEKKVYTEEDAVRFQLYRLYILVIMAAEIFRYGFLYGRLQYLWSLYGIRKCLDFLERGD